MSLTKKQLEVVDALQNGGHIWTASGLAYLSKVVKNRHSGHESLATEKLNERTFRPLVEKGVIKKVDGANKYVLNESA